MTTCNGRSAAGPHRPLGLWEKVFVIAQSQTGMYNITSKVVLSSRREIEDKLVKKSLENLSKRHPLLRSTIGSYGGVKSFVVNDLDPVLRHSEEADSHSVMENELLEIFDDEKSLWRVTRLKTFSDNERYIQTFIFTFHHAIVDGNAIIQIYRDFLTFLEKALRGIDCDVISLPLRQSRDVIFGNRSACSLSRRIRHALSYLFWECVCPTIKEDAFIAKMIHQFRPNQPIRRTRCIQINFTEDLTNQVIESCKRNDVRVNSLFSSLVARSLRQLLLDYDVISLDDVIDFNSECYVNMRRFTDDLNDEDLGLYMTHVPTPVRLRDTTDTTIWQDAKLYDNNLHHCLDSQSFFHDYQQFQNALKTLGPKNIAKVISLTDHRSMPYYISNLGRIELLPDVECDDEFICRFDELHQTVGEFMTLVDGSVFIHSIATVNGRIFWTLGYHAHQVSEQVAQELARLIRATAEEACKTS